MKTQMANTKDGNPSIKNLQRIVEYGDTATNLELTISSSSRLIYGHAKHRI